MSSDASQWQSIFETSAIKTYSTYGQDCNYPLLVSLLNNMQAVSAKPDYLIITGDFLCHNFQSQFTTNSGISYQADSLQQFAPCNSFVQKTMQFLTGIFSKYFPQAPVYAALGNNDSYCGDYLVQPGGTFLSMLSALWKPLLHTDSTASFDTYFPKGGYYSIPSAVNSNLRMIILNTVLFSTSFNSPGSWVQPYCTLGNEGKDNDKPGLQQLVWLKKELAVCRATGQKAWIIQHIPLGMNVFNNIPDSGAPCVKDTVYFMKQLFNNAYLNIVREYSDVIASSMAGHYHMDDFRLVMDNTGSKAVAYLHVLPAVSPVYDNNPAFETVQYDRSASKLLDYTVYYTDVSNTVIKPWAPEYNFRATYGQPDITAGTLLAAHQRLGNDSALANTYMRYYPVSYKVSWQQDIQHFRYYWCGMQYLTAKGFTACVCGKIK